MTVVTPTGRPKWMRNCCVIDVFGSIFVFSIDFRIFRWYRGFVIGLSQISFFFSLQTLQLVLIPFVVMTTYSVLRTIDGVVF